MVGEPWDFSGPDGENKIIVEMLGLVDGPQEDYWAPKHILFSVPNPFQFKGHTVTQLIAAPRYEGVSLRRIRTIGGTVGACRVEEGRELQVGSQFQSSDVEYIIIGGLRRVLFKNITT